MTLPYVVRQPETVPFDRRHAGGNLRLVRHAPALGAPCPTIQSDSRGECKRCTHLLFALNESQVQLMQARRQLEQTQQEERTARHLAHHDGLTNLPNLRAFMDRLSAALAHSFKKETSLAVMFIDLDHFKVINDTHGHRVGDQLLKVVGARLAQVVRADDVAARLGGDEFACLIRRAPSIDHLAQLASKLYEVVSAPMQLGSLSLQVTPSIGIAVYPCGPDHAALDAEHLVASADRAMYMAKRDQCRYAFAPLDSVASP